MTPSRQPPPVPENVEALDEQERQELFEQVLDHVMEKDAELFDRLADA